MKSTEFDRSYERTMFWLIVGAILALGIMLFLPFANAIMWAIVFAVLMAPFYKRLRERRSENVSAALSVAATLLLIVLPVCIIGFVVYLKVVVAVQEANIGRPSSVVSGKRPAIVDELDSVAGSPLKAIGIQFSVAKWYDENKDEVGKTVSGPLARFAVNAASTLLNFVVALMTLFFLLRDGHKLREPAMDLIPLDRQHTERIVGKMAETIRAVFVGVVLVSIIQGAVAGLCYLALGVPSPLLWGIATIIACMIPLLGAPMVYLPVAIYLIMNGHWIEGIIMLGLGFGIISNIDNFVRPFVIGSKTDLHYMAVFFSLLGGVLAFGPVGIMAGPVIMTALLALVDIARARQVTIAEEKA